MMAKKFACRDIGLECDFEAESESREELMQKIAEHAKSAHGMEQIDEATMAKVEAAIKDAPAEEEEEEEEEAASAAAPEQAEDEQ